MENIKLNWNFQRFGGFIPKNVLCQGEYINFLNNRILVHPVPRTFISCNVNFGRIFPQNIDIKILAFVL